MEPWGKFLSDNIIIVAAANVGGLIGLGFVLLQAIRSSWQFCRIVWQRDVRAAVLRVKRRRRFEKICAIRDMHYFIGKLFIYFSTTFLGLLLGVSNAIVLGIYEYGEELSPLAFDAKKAMLLSISLVLVIWGMCHFYLLVDYASHVIYRRARQDRRRSRSARRAARALASRAASAATDQERTSDAHPAPVANSR